MAGLTPIELSAVLTNRSFANLITEAVDRTLDTDMEAGFVVYKDQGGAISFSDILHPDTEYIEALEAAEKLSAEAKLKFILRQLVDAEEPLGMLPQLDLGRLITDQNINLRTDLAVVTHTHPVTTLGRRKIIDPERILLPSSRDIINLGEQAASNPGIIGGTLATHRNLGGTALFLMRPGSADAIQRIQAFEEGSTVSEQVITNLGLLSTRVVFDRHDGRVVSGLETISRLYPDAA